MAGSHDIDAWYVRQTVHPKYFEEVEPGTEDFKGVLRIIQVLHRSLAAVESTSGRDAVVGYALTSKQLGPVLCLSRAEFKSDRSARPYVEMQTLVARADDVERLGLSAVDLYLAADWDRLRASKNATVSLTAPPRKPPLETPENVEIFDLILSRFTGEAEAPMEWPGNLASAEVATMVREAMLKLDPKNRVRATFAWGIPRTCKLPGALNVVIDDRPGNRKKAAEPSRTAPVSPKDLLAHLDALSFAGRPVLSETAELFWELRLSLARRRIRADALDSLRLPGHFAPGKRPADSVREGVRRLRQDLAGEPSKAGLDHALRRWLVDFERSRGTEAEPGPPHSSGWWRRWALRAVGTGIAVWAAWGFFGPSSRPAARPAQHKSAAGIAGAPASQGVKPKLQTNAMDGAVMVWVPDGTFTMGSDNGESDEKPAHEVRLTKGFWLYRTPVTNAQFRKFLVANPQQAQPQYWTDPRFNSPEQPVVGVTRDDAAAYCRWAKCRLPTEAEWEYAARGPKSSTYPWGEEPPNANRAVFGQDNGTGRPAVVGSKPAGASWCGAWDMTGNVWQWCADWYDNSYYSHSPPQDPEGPDGFSSVVRGGSWDSDPRSLRASFRSRFAPGGHDVNLGFRPVGTATAVAATPSSSSGGSAERSAASLANETPDITATPAGTPEPLGTRANPMDGALMVHVTAGAFTMGSETADNDERPVHKVRLTKSFWLYRTPVTHAQYEKFLAANPQQGQPQSWTDPRFNTPQQPVVGVTWNDATAYCQWAKCRLPTEAEWEYAARGRKGSTFPWGEEPPDASRAVFDQGGSTGRPAVVGSKLAGASWCGALDMAGNVWQWCADYYESSYYSHSPSENPHGPADGSLYVLRGSGWDAHTDWLRASSRFSNNADNRQSYNGFRPAWPAP